MDRKSWVTLVLVLLGCAVGGHGVFTNSGPVGWLNAVQQRILGGYYGLLSFTLVLVAVMVIGGLAWDGLARMLGLESEGVTRQVLLGPQGSAPRPAVAASAYSASAQGLTFFVVATAATVLTWGAAGAFHVWRMQSLQEDASAVYEPIELSEGMPVPRVKGAHLALRGIPVTERVVVHQTGDGTSKREDYRLVPVVGVGWKPDRPVSFVVKVDASHGLPGPPTDPGWVPRNPREVRLLVRRNGAVPAPALQEFQRMGAPIAADAVLVGLVETKNGKPALPEDAGDLFFLKIACGGLTFIYSLLSLALWLRRRYDLRRAAKLAAAR